MTLAVVATRADDRSAFMDRLAPLLSSGMRLAYGMLGNGHEAEDALQEAAFNAWRAWSRFDPSTEVRPWFLTIVANECRRRRRSRWWSVTRLAEVPVVGDPPPDHGDDVAELKAALRRLPTNMRLVLVLRYYLDLPFAEIARTLKCSPQAAKSRAHRALERLRVEVPRELEP